MDDFVALREDLLAERGVPVVVVRDGQELLETVAAIVRVKNEDVDKTQGVAYSNTVDFIFRPIYEPEIGDEISVDASFDDSRYVVKPIFKEVWRWTDPYKTTRRVHAQRREK